MEYAKGASKCEAYRRAGYTGDPKSCVGTIHANPRVQELIQEYVDKAEDETIASVTEVCATLTKIITDKAEKTSDRIGAASLLSRIKGYGPQGPSGRETTVTLPTGEKVTMTDLVADAQVQPEQP